MKIEKIAIKNFRIFEDTTINLGTHLSCISGYNGVGKSTLLAILSNIGELKKDAGTHINGDAFRGEFSQIIHGVEPYDTTGEKCTIYFSDLPDVRDGEHIFPAQLSFRSTFQSKPNIKEVRKKVNAIINGKEQLVTIIEKDEKKGFRYRLLPIETEERNTVSKLRWPTYYLGLSRLYPIGESEEIKSKGNATDLIFNEIMKEHKNILTSNDDYLATSSIEISDIKKKKGFGVKTKDYSEKMNSSGQDNLGQILTSIFSFQNLKDNLKEKYNGGLLLIDEIDATLHPVAQNNLIDFLYKKAEELDIQIIFTTHSLSLLEHLVKKQGNIGKEYAINLVYLMNKRGKLEIKENPSKKFLNNDLMNTYTGALRSQRVPIFTEDDTARWFLSKILEHNEFEFMQIDLINMNIGWEQIIKLIKRDFNYYRNHLVILDPDLNIPVNKRNLEKHIEGSQYSLSKQYRNILILPGDNNVETIMWNYLSSLPVDHRFFYEPEIENGAVNKQSLINHGPSSAAYTSITKPLAKHKAWFQANKWICDIAILHWFSEEENQKLVAKFYNEFKDCFNPIHYRM